MQMTVPVIQTALKFCFWSCFLFTVELGFLFFMHCCLFAFVLSDLKSITLSLGHLSILFRLTKFICIEKFSVLVK
jgi:hypothetical protein